MKYSWYSNRTGLISMEADTAEEARRKIIESAKVAKLTKTYRNTVESLITGNPEVGDDVLLAKKGNKQ